MAGAVVAVSREFRGLGRELRPVPPGRRGVWRVVGWLLRHLPEIALLWLAVIGWNAAANRIGPLWTGLVVGAVVAGLVGWPRSRRWLLAGAGCVVTRWRLRAALIELRLTTHAGRLPVVVGLVPTPVGERVWLWSRVGISAEDIADESDRLRAACYARDVRVVRDRRWSSLVRVDVIRRDPLASSNTVPSPLARLIPNIDERGRDGG